MSRETVEVIIGAASVAVAVVFAVVFVCSLTTPPAEHMPEVMERVMSDGLLMSPYNATWSAQPSTYTPAVPLPEWVTGKGSLVIDCDNIGGFDGVVHLKKRGVMKQIKICEE